jgi:hypothetical protein
VGPCIIISILLSSSIFIILYLSYIAYNRPGLTPGHFLVFYLCSRIGLLPYNPARRWRGLNGSRMLSCGDPDAKGLWWISDKSCTCELSQSSKHVVQFNRFGQSTVLCWRVVQIGLRWNVTRELIETLLVCRVAARSISI